MTANRSEEHRARTSPHIFWAATLAALALAACGSSSKAAPDAATCLAVGAACFTEGNDKVIALNCCSGLCEAINGGPAVCVAASTTPDASLAVIDAPPAVIVDAPGPVGDGGVVPDAGPVSHILLFGGVTGDGTILGDTWTWDGAGWTQHNVPGPAVRSSGVAAALGGKAIIFGGLGQIDDAGLNALGDTWSWDGQSWTVVATTGPDPRGAGAAGALGGQMILFGGYGPDHGGEDDTWRWDGHSWTQLLPSVIPQTAGLPVVEAESIMQTFGDTLLLTDGGDMYSWSGNAWTNLNPTLAATGPGVRVGATGTVLGANLVFFGGGSAASDGMVTFDDTWLWNGTAWTQVFPSGAPPPRIAAHMATLGNQAVLFGGISVGNDANTTLGDTWIWNGTTWTEYTGPAPSARNSAFMVAY